MKNTVMTGQTSQLQIAAVSSLLALVSREYTQLVWYTTWFYIHMHVHVHVHVHVAIRVHMTLACTLLLCLLWYLKSEYAKTQLKVFKSCHH